MPAATTWASGIAAFPITLTSATPKIVDFTSIRIDGVATTSSDFYNVWDSSLSGSEDAIGFKQTGVYLINGKVEWATSGAYEKDIELQGFGTDLGLGDTRFVVLSQSEAITYQAVTALLILSTVNGDGIADYVRLVATHTAGANRDIDDCALKVVRLGNYT